jgi:hypothetical protein
LASSTLITKKIFFQKKWCNFQKQVKDFFFFWKGKIFFFGKILEYIYIYNLKIFWLDGVFKRKVIIPCRNVELGVVVHRTTTEFVKV